MSSRNKHNNSNNNDASGKNSSHTSKKDLPPIVLRCPDCGFLCTSNNQMCRHIFMTMHGLTRCPDCEVHLVSWGFAPGVLKLFQQAKRTGVLLEDVKITTADRHIQETGHTRALARNKDEFIVEGKPEDYGLQPLTRPTMAESATKYACPVCCKVIGSWVQMTKHMEATRHGLTKCAECDMYLRCFGSSQPNRHERTTGHRGLQDVFRCKQDFLAENMYTTTPSIEQYRCPECQQVFLNPAFFVEHMLTHNIAVEGYCTAEGCDFKGKGEELLNHRRENPDHKLSLSDAAREKYKALLPAIRTLEDRMKSGDCRILYQCPECSQLFSSWSKLEKHLQHTRHSLAFCPTCDAHIGPKTGGPEEHDSSHRELFGEQRSKQDYEVIVDVRDPEYLDLLDQPEKSAHELFLRSVYQCPDPSCLRVFETPERLKMHMGRSKHGEFDCETCGETISLLNNGLAQHEMMKGHPVPNVPEHLQGLEYEEDFKVRLTNRELYTWFPAQFRECDLCETAVSVHDYASHRGSNACHARKAIMKRLKMLLDEESRSPIATEPAPRRMPMIPPANAKFMPPAPSASATANNNNNNNNSISQNTQENSTGNPSSLLSTGPSANSLTTLGSSGTNLIPPTQPSSVSATNLNNSTTQQVDQQAIVPQQVVSQNGTNAALNTAAPPAPAPAANPANFINQQYLDMFNNQQQVMAGAPQPGTMKALNGFPQMAPPMPQQPPQPQQLQLPPQPQQSQVFVPPFVNQQQQHQPAAFQQQQQFTQQFAAPPTLNNVPVQQQQFSQAAQQLAGPPVQQQYTQQQQQQQPPSTGFMQPQQLMAPQPQQYPQQFQQQQQQQQLPPPVSFGPPSSQPQGFPQLQPGQPMPPLPQPISNGPPSAGSMGQQPPLPQAIMTGPPSGQLHQPQQQPHHLQQVQLLPPQQQPQQQVLAGYPHLQWAQ